MKLHLGIKNKHIDFGERTNPSNCAIAKALKGKIRNLDKVGVFPNFAYIIVKNRSKTQAYKAKLNKAAAAFIKNFDDYKPVAPFELNLNFKLIKVAKELV
jgi:hypothetical protein